MVWLFNEAGAEELVVIALIAAVIGVEPDSDVIVRLVRAMCLGICEDGDLTAAEQGLKDRECRLATLAERGG